MTSYFNKIILCHINGNILLNLRNDISSLKDIHSDYLKGISRIPDNSRRGHKTWRSVTGTLQQIIPGKVPEGDLAICHIPGTCMINHQSPLIGIIPLRGLFITSCRDLIISSLWQPFDLSSIATNKGNKIIIRGTRYAFKTKLIRPAIIDVTTLLQLKSSSL